jgi:uncharacterized cofD-like protein
MSVVGDGAHAAVCCPGRREPATVPSALRIVALGGGTGVPLLLRGLKDVVFPHASPWRPAADRDRITAIVTTADDGGSSGRLRRAYRVSAPGDIRNSLLALSGADRALASLFDFRFGGENEVTGHSLGNLILAALTHLEGDLVRAVDRAGEILNVRGRVVPSTTEDVTLSAEFVDGSCIDGESRIAAVRRPIRQVRLRPEAAPAAPEAVRAIEAADLVAIGPGSLYTSLIPVLLVRELAQALARSRARVVLVMNLMSEPGETDGYGAGDCLPASRRPAPHVPIHHVLLNMAPIPRDALDRYAADGAMPIRVDVETLRALGCRSMERDVLGDGPKIRHDSRKLARAVLELATEVHDE